MYSISLEVFAIVSLCFTISMAKRHVSDKKKNVNYRVTCMITILLLVLEIATILMAPSDNEKFVIPNRIANILGFSFSPAVPFSLLLFYYNENERTWRKIFMCIPLCLNALMCVLSYKTGWIFFVDSQNQYTRGSLFLLPAVISLFYYALMVRSAIKNSNEYEIEDRKTFIAIILLPLLASILQIIFRDLILIWSCAALSLLLYYVFLRELLFTNDIQTGVKNRAAFENEMTQYGNSNQNAVIFMFDLNNLKETNDVYGHKAGDELILDAARSIKECFRNIGNTYRIGGDEFCVICEEIPKQLAERSLLQLDDLLIEVNQNRQNKIILAYGYAFYNRKESESIYSALSQADKAMYTHKAKLKGFYGRRSDDQKVI